MGRAEGLSDGLRKFTSRLVAQSVRVWQLATWLCISSAVVQSFPKAITVRKGSKLKVLDVGYIDEKTAQY